MADETSVPGDGLVLADLSIELEQHRPKVPDGCAACRACALWTLSRWSSAERTME